MEGDKFIRYDSSIRSSNGTYKCISCKTNINQFSYKISHVDGCFYKQYENAYYRLEGCVYSFGDNEKWQIPFLVLQEKVKEAKENEGQIIVIRYNKENEVDYLKKHTEFLKNILT